MTSVGGASGADRVPVELAFRRTPMWLRRRLAMLLAYALGPLAVWAAFGVVMHGCSE